MWKGGFPISKSPLRPSGHLRSGASSSSVGSPGTDLVHHPFISGVIHDYRGLFIEDTAARRRRQQFSRVAIQVNSGIRVRPQN